MTQQALLSQALELATAFLDGLRHRPVGVTTPVEKLRSRVARPLPVEGVEATRVIRELAYDVEPGLIASAGPRYFGFVIGGSLPVTLAADWLTSAWDQNACLYAQSPAAAVVEEVVAAWLLEILGLPATASVGLVTGCQMANFAGLAAARHAVLKRFGWDVEQDGLIGAPDLRVILGAEAHFTILSALRMLGIGVRRVVEVPADGEGRMRPEALAPLLRSSSRPTIVCAQAGNVNTGACDPVGEIAELAHASGAWVHVDGAFGLWAAASPELRRHVAGLAKADSWATDAHKWLNVPFDSGIAIVADPESHRAALTARAAYLVQASGAERDGLDWTPEASRRARAFTLYAALRTLGRRGVARLVERSCGLARLMAECLSAEPGVRILNDVMLNQVLVGFEAPAGRNADALTIATIARIQREGACWLGGTRWNGREAARISVSNWSTTEEDIRGAARAIVDAFRAERTMSRSMRP
jgi:glutamate/tyrosine decarboxylase-like PLP-dependent enzyme